MQKIRVLSLKFLLILISAIFSNVYAQDTVILYLNEQFMKTQPENAKYIREAIIHNDHYFVTDKTVDGKNVRYGEYSSLNPWTEDGKAIHYDKNHRVYAKGQYKNDKMVGQWIYFNKDNTTDTVYYSPEMFYSQTDDCLESKDFTKKNSTDEVGKTVHDSLNTFLIQNFHLPPRTWGKQEVLPPTMTVTIDTVGKVVCSELSDPYHPDVEKEIFRMLHLFHCNNTTNQPIHLQLKLRPEQFDGVEEDVYFIVEDMPTFYYKKCTTYDINCFRSYIQNQIKSFTSDCEGRVIVRFEVDKNGQVDNVEIVDAPEDCYDYAEEIQDIFYASPEWKPGRQRGKKVRISFTVPIVFDPHR